MSQSSAAWIPTSSRHGLGKQVHDDDYAPRWWSLLARRRWKGRRAAYHYMRDTYENLIER